jgi:hypothetical protein
VAFEAEDLDRLIKTLESMLDRFKDSGSISLFDCTVPTINNVGKGRQTERTVTYSLPKEDRVKEVREAWKHDRRSIPKSGLLLDLTIDGIEELYKSSLETKSKQSTFKYANEYSKFIKHYV